MHFDTTWETDFYSQGKHLNRYPFDIVVSFIFRYFPREKPRHHVRILEVGCGSGNNLWFAAREGFHVFGLDGSPSAIQYAKERFAAEGLEADLQLGDFTTLPYSDNFFDMVIDRGAITCCSRADACCAVEEIHRVLQPSGFFLHNSYSEKHFSATQGERDSEGTVHNIRAGTFAGIGQLYFYTEDEIRTLFAKGWSLECLQHIRQEDVLGTIGDHCEWRVVARREDI